MKVKLKLSLHLVRSSSFEEFIKGNDGKIIGVKFHIPRFFFRRINEGEVYTDTFIGFKKFYSSIDSHFVLTINLIIMNLRLYIISKLK